MGVYFHVLEGFLVANAEHKPFGGLKAVAVVVGAQGAEFAEGMAAGVFQFVAQGIDIVFPHLAGHLGAHTFTLGQQAHHAVVAGGGAVEYEGSVGGVVYAARFVVPRTLQFAAEGADAGEFHAFALFQLFYDKVGDIHGMLFLSFCVML